MDGSLPASVDVPFALLVYAFRFTTIYMLALNFKCGCPSANRRFSYICPVERVVYVLSADSSPR